LIGFMAIVLRRARQVVTRNRSPATGYRREVFMNLIRLASLVVVGACGTSAALAAAPLRLQEAVSRALAAHPSITAETAQLQAIRARTQREALPPPYTIGGEVGNFAGNGNL
jgi:cobalt-zinc-cadmium efflux system outer membrane protein